MDKTEVHKTDIFSEWLEDLKDVVGKAAIMRGVKKMEKGVFANCKPVGDGVFEQVYTKSPGYRVYYTRIDKKTILLLLGGTKRRQQADIERAKQMLKEIKKDETDGNKNKQV